MELAANRHHKQGECAQPIGARAAAPPTGPRRRWSCEGHCRDRCGLRSSAAPENHSMKVSQRPGAPNDGRLSLCGVLAGCTPPRVICKCCTAHDQHLQALVSPQGFRMELLGVSPRGRRQKRLASGARQPETHAKQAELGLREHRRELLSTRAASDARHPCRRPQRRPISLPGAPDASSLLLPPGWGFSPVGALRPPPSGPAKGPVHWYAPPCAVSACTAGGPASPSGSRWHLPPPPAQASHARPAFTVQSPGLPPNARSGAALELLLHSQAAAAPNPPSGGTRTSCRPLLSVAVGPGHLWRRQLAVWQTAAARQQQQQKQQHRLAVRQLV